MEVLISSTDDYAFVYLKLRNSSTVKQSPYSLMHNSSSQLPKLKLKKFNGEPSKLSEWTSMFIKTVSNKPVVRSEKVSHQKTVLCGKAKAAKSGNCFSENFQLTPKKTFEREFAALVEAHLEN